MCSVCSPYVNLNADLNHAAIAMLLTVLSILSSCTVYSKRTPLSSTQWMMPSKSFAQLPSDQHMHVYIKLLQCC